jgi:hypothetical protein
MVDKSVKITAMISVTVTVIAISGLIAVLPFKQSIQANYSDYSGMKKEFWLFNSDIPGFNETKMDMPDDVFSMHTIAVFKGDTVVIHFFNTEGPGGDHHSFTIIDKPYNINVDLGSGENKTITFDANTQEYSLIIAHSINPQ